MIIDDKKLALEKKGDKKRANLHVCNMFGNDS